MVDYLKFNNNNNHCNKYKNFKALNPNSNYQPRQILLLKHKLIFMKSQTTKTLNPEAVKLDLVNNIKVILKKDSSMSKISRR